MQCAMFIQAGVGSAQLSTPRHSPGPSPCSLTLPRIQHRSTLRQQGGAKRADTRAAAQSSAAAAAAAAKAPTATPHTPKPAKPEDVVVVAACRTASTRARKGGFKDTRPDDLVAAVLAAAIKKAGLNPEDVDDVCMGSVFNSSSKRANECRIGALLAGLPASVPIHTVNRQCAAGLQAIADTAAAISAGYIKVGIAGGVETMTINGLDWQGSENPRVKEGAQYSKDAQDIWLPLGLTADNVAGQFGVTRETQDRLAAASHAKAAAAQEAGKFKDEIVPVETVQKDTKTGDEIKVVVDKDDGIRPDCTPEKLAQLKPYFKKDGTVTAGNCCQNTDCAAAVVLMARAEAEKRGLPVLGTLRSFAAVGVPPAVMGIAPTVAIPKALDSAGLSKDDIDVIELNEAFASQFAYCMRELGLDEEKVNPNGGAIALGHPAGATGARLAVTLLHELARRNNGNGNGKGAHYGVVALCTGSGLGAAAVFEAGSANGGGKGSE